MNAFDWGIVVAYMAAVLAVGTLVGRGRRGTDEMFLAGRSVPTWAAMLSFVATIQSAATFVAGPEMVFRNDLRHLLRITGSITGAFIVAYWILPRLYNSGKTTVYAVLEDRFGRPAQVGASLLFLMGGLLSAGARLMIAGVAFAMILFGEMHLGTVLATILIVGVVGTIYTATGGLRAVVWTDVIQAGTYLLAAVGCVVTLAVIMPVSWSEVWRILQTGGTTGHAKLQLFDWRWSWSSDDTFWASLVGLSFYHVGSFTTQQDQVQRLLACRSAAAARKALLRGIGLIFASSWLFASIGLLLFAFHQASGIAVTDSRKVYPEFIMHYLPAGLRGLVATGIFAAAMSSIDSMINSMATCALCDLRAHKRLGDADARGDTRRYRWIVILFGALLMLAAGAMGVIQLRGNREMFDFAVMSAFYGISGLLGVFLAALFTRRGNAWSANLGLVAGGAAVGACALLPDISRALGVPKVELGFPWWLVVGVTASFLTCIAARSGRRAPAGSGGAGVSRGAAPAGGLASAGSTEGTAQL